MSYNEKLCGFSYKIDIPKEERISFVKKHFPKLDVDSLIEKYDDDDWFYEFMDNDRKSLGVWKLMLDYKNNLAWVYILESGESNGDIKFSVSLNEMEDYSDTLRNRIGDIDNDNFKAFAIDWYNGCDCPLIF